MSPTLIRLYRWGMCAWTGSARVTARVCAEAARSWSGGVRVLALFACVADAGAQSEAVAADSEVHRLSPFVVTAPPDEDWAAATTLAGTRTDHEIARMPVAVDVLTRSFFEDLRLGSLEEAASFIAGVTVQPRFESRNDEGRMGFRGLAGPLQTSRNFFPWYVSADTYNVERLDFSKGSNSLIFGDSMPGGQVTLTTKRPDGPARTRLEAGADNFGGRIWRLDANRPLNRWLALRLNAVDRDERTYVRDSHRQLQAGDLALLIQPSATTSLLLEGERGRYERRRGENSAAILDVAAPGRGFSQNKRWYYTSDGEIVRRPSAAVASVDTVAASGGVHSLLDDQAVAVRLPDGSSQTIAGFDRHLNLLGINDYLDRRYTVFTATLDQRLGPLDFNVSFNQQQQEQQRNDNSFGTSQTPPIVSVDGRGRPYLDLAGSAPFKVFGNRVQAGRASVSYTFDGGAAMQQRLVVSAMRQKDHGYSHRYFLANEAGEGAIQDHLITLRAYLDDPAVATPGFWNQFLFSQLPQTATFRPKLFETYVRSSPFVDVRYNRTLSASLAGDYGAGRVQSLVGLSWHRVSRKIPVSETYALDARGLITPPGGPEANPAAYTYDPAYALGARTATAGAVGEVLRTTNARLSVYATHSESFNWQAAQTFYGQALGPVLGATRELGLRGEAWRGWSVSAAAFHIRRRNVAYTWAPDLLSAESLENLINPNGLSRSDPAYVSVVDGLNSERRTVSSGETSQGVELTLQGRRAAGWQTRVTAAWIRVAATPDFAPFQSYLNAATARTAAALASGGDPSLAEDATALANARTILAAGTQSDEVVGRRSAPFTGSFVVDYQPPALAQVRLGLQGVFTSRYNLGLLDGVAYRGGAQLPLGVYAVLSGRIAGRTCAIRASVQNLWDPLNGRAPRETGVFGLDSATRRPNYLYRYTDPATYALALDLEL